MTIIKIDDEIGYWGISASDIIRQLDEASGDIEIHISSPGGVIFEGVSIFNAIKAYKKGHVTTIITSLAASMASVIALAGDTVKAYDNAVYMIHNASMMAWGDAKYFRKKADHLESLSNLMANIYIAKSGKSEKEIKQLLDDETYFYGIEMKDAGFIDEIIESNIDNDDSSSALALASESFQSCMKHYRENAKDDESEQIAAFLKEDENSGENRNHALAKNQNSDKGDSMEYTEQTFKALKDENAEALKMGIESATADEKKRVGGIFSLNGSAEFTAKAIEDGTSVGDAAIALVKTKDEALTKAKTDFEKASEELDGSAEGENSELTAEQELEKEADDALESVKV